MNKLLILIGTFILSWTTLIVINQKALYRTVKGKDGDGIMILTTIQAAAITMIVAGTIL
jgi:hypothetical protein